MRAPETIIDTLQLSEKGIRLSEGENKFLFRVVPSANKLEIKNAIEKLFDVEVTKVNTLNRLGKKKRAGGRVPGRRANWKRAVVTLKDGDTIDFT